MTIKTDFSFKKITIFSIAVLGLCFCSGYSMAQSEHGKSEMEHEKPTDKPLLENQSDRMDAHIQDVQIPAAANVTSVKAPLPKKETNLSGEGKKVEPAPSTLSFNIFLYIVDKFRAD